MREQRSPYSAIIPMGGGESKVFDLCSEPDYFLYASQYAAAIEAIRRGLRDGVLTVTVDWNRSGRNVDDPQDGVIYRVHVLKGDGE